MDAAESRGLEDRSVIVSRRRRPFSRPNSGWSLLMAMGVGLLGGAAWLTDGPAIEAIGEKWPPFAQAVMLGAGLFCLGWGFARARRPKPEWATDGFLFADASTFWDVTPSRVRATPLRRLRGVDAVHRSKNKVYDHTIIKLYLSDDDSELKTRPAEYTVHSRRSAEWLRNYLKALRSCHNSDEVESRALAEGEPGRLGVFAARVAKDGPLADLSDLPDVPAPFLPPETSVAPPRSPVIVLGLLATAIACGSYFAFADFDRRGQDDRLFAQAEAEPSSASADRYLATFPAGRHAVEAEALRDDRRYGELAGRAGQSPQTVRMYLADPANVRHRDEARELLARTYEPAIARLETVAAKEPLARGMIELLKAVRSADSPVVPVAVRAVVRMGAAPGEADVLRGRGMSVDDFVMGRQTSAVIDPSPVFSPQAIAAREGQVLDRLREAVGRGVGSEFLSFEAAPPDVKPMVIVEYRVVADGTISEFRSWDITTRSGGLVRMFDVEWTVRVRPPHADEAVGVIRWPAPQKLTYDSRPDDPACGIYSALFCSAGYEFASNLSGSLGFGPGPTPPRFTAAGASWATPNNGIFGGPAMPFAQPPNFPQMPDFPAMPNFPRRPLIPAPGDPGFPDIRPPNFPDVPGLPRDFGRDRFGRPGFDPRNPWNR